jgi:Zn-dependent protease with chaperone function/tetratricopeptide (TPR) repeat protein
MLAYEPNAWRITAIAYITLVVMAILTGRKQRVELGASWRRLVWMAFCVAPIAFLPALTAIVMGGYIDISWLSATSVVGLSMEEMEALSSQGAIADPRFDAESLTWSARLIDGPSPGESASQLLFSGLIPASPSVNIVVVVVLSLLGIGVVAATFQPIWRLLGERVRCTVVTDPAILERTRELVRSTGGTVPRILRISASEASTKINAAAIGLLAPAIIATDGLLNRLEEEETGALLAHELGHLARDHSRKGLLVFATVIVSVTFASAFLFPTVALALAPLLLVILHQWNGRREEIACDLLAARVVGFVPTARALDKICGQVGVDCGPRLARVTRALDEHPARHLRLRYLARSAGARDRERIVYDPAEASSQVVVDRAVVAVHLLVFAFGVVSGLTQTLQYYGIGAIVALLLARVALPYASYSRRLYYAWQLRNRATSVRLAIRIAAAAGSITALVVGLWAPYAWPTWIGFFVLVMWTRRRRRKQRRLQCIYAAVAGGELAAALDHCDALPKRWRRGAVHRRYRGHLLAAMDRMEESRRIFDALVTESPRDWGTQLWRATITGWIDESAGLAISAHVAKHLPRNPHALAALAADLSVTEDLDAAEPRILDAIRLLPAEGSFYGIHSAILRRRGELEASEARLAEFEARDPGSHVILIYRGYLHLARHDCVAAAEAASQAREAGENDRMSLVLPHVRRLEAKIAEASG